MPYPSLYEVPAYQKALPWIIEDVRKAARNLSGAPVWMPTPQPGEELDGILWIRQFLEHDKRGIRSDPTDERVLSFTEKQRLILGALADGEELVVSQIAEIIGFATSYTGSTLTTMEDAYLVERGDGAVSNGRRVQTWRLYQENVVPDISLDAYLAQQKADSKMHEIVRIMHKRGPLPISNLIQVSGFAQTTVHKHTKSLRLRGLAQRRRLAVHGAAHCWFLTGDERASRER